MGFSGLPWIAVSGTQRSSGPRRRRRETTRQRMSGAPVRTSRPLLRGRIPTLLAEVPPHSGRSSTGRTTTALVSPSGVSRTTDIRWSPHTGMGRSSIVVRATTVPPFVMSSTSITVSVVRLAQATSHASGVWRGRQRGSGTTEKVQSSPSGVSDTCRTRRGGGASTCQASTSSADEGGLDGNQSAFRTSTRSRTPGEDQRLSS